MESDWIYPSHRHHRHHHRYCCDRHAMDLIETELSEFSQTEFFNYLKQSSVNLSETIKHLTEVVQINLSTKEKI